MADGKRQPMSGKNATPRTGGQALSELDAALSKVVGARIKIVTSSKDVLEGVLFTSCSITNVIALNTRSAPPNPTSITASQPGDYHIVPVSQIHSLQVLSLPSSAERVEGSSPSFNGALPSITRLDLDALKKREDNLVKVMKEKDALRGRGVTKEAQEIFDAMRKTLPAYWSGTTIVVNDAVTIEKPYGVKDCKAAKDKQNSLNQVTKILEAHLRRSAVATPRKGG